VDPVWVWFDEQRLLHLRKHCSNPRGEPAIQPSRTRASQQAVAVNARLELLVRAEGVPRPVQQRARHGVGGPSILPDQVGDIPSKRAKELAQARLVELVDVPPRWVWPAALRARGPADARVLAERDADHCDSARDPRNLLAGPL
jgi:hypothetical protein